MPGYPVNAMPPRDIHEQSWADPTYRNATTGARVGAYFIDNLILGIVSIIPIRFALLFFAVSVGELFTGYGGLEEVILTMVSGLILYILACVIPPCYKVLLEATMGATLGKKILRLRLISTDGEKVGFRRAAKRNAMQLCVLIPGIGIFFPGIDNLVRFISVSGSPYNQGYQDRWGSTRLIQE